MVCFKTLRLKAKSSRLLALLARLDLDLALQKYGQSLLQQMRISSQSLPTNRVYGIVPLDQLRPLVPSSLIAVKQLSPVPPTPYHSPFFDPLPRGNYEASRRRSFFPAQLPHTWSARLGISTQLSLERPGVGGWSCVSISRVLILTHTRAFLPDG